MAIPAAQCDVWRNQGATATAVTTHQAVRNALNADSSPMRERDHEIYLTPISGRGSRSESTRNPRGSCWRRGSSAYSPTAPCRSCWSSTSWAGLEPAADLLLTPTLVGDTIVSLYLTTRADRLGHRGMLIVGATLMAAAALVFTSTGNRWLLLLAGTVGVISPSGPATSDKEFRNSSVFSATPSGYADFEKGMLS